MHTCFKKHLSQKMDKKHFFGIDSYTVRVNNEHASFSYCGDRSCSILQKQLRMKKKLPSDNKQSPNIISLQVITPLISLCKTLLSLTKVIRASANLVQQEMFTGAQRWKNGIGALVIQEKNSEKKLLLCNINATSTHKWKVN